MSLQDTTSKCDLDLASVLVSSDEHGSRPLTWFVSVLHDCFDCQIKTKDETKTLRVFVEHVKMNDRNKKILIIKDMTNAARADEQKQTTNRLIVQLAQIAHDLKAPLRCIDSSSNLLLGLVDQEDPEVKTLHRNMRSNFEFAYSMIEDV